MRKLLNIEEQKAYLYDKIGSSVNFKYPKKEGIKRGNLVDRVVILDRENDLVVYWNMIDLIKFEDEDKNWIGITYYRYKKKEINGFLQVKHQYQTQFVPLLNYLSKQLEKKNGLDLFSEKLINNVLRN